MSRRGVRIQSTTFGHQNTEILTVRVATCDSGDSAVVIVSGDSGDRARSTVAVDNAVLTMVTATATVTAVTVTVTL